MAQETRAEGRAAKSRLARRFTPKFYLLCNAHCAVGLQKFLFAYRPTIVGPFCGLLAMRIFKPNCEIKLSCGNFGKLCCARLRSRHGIAIRTNVAKFRRRFDLLISLRTNHLFVGT